MPLPQVPMPSMADAFNDYVTTTTAISTATATRTMSMNTSVPSIPRQYYLQPWYPLPLPSSTAYTTQYPLPAYRFHESVKENINNASHLTINNETYSSKNNQQQQQQPTTSKYGHCICNSKECKLLLSQRYKLFGKNNARVQVPLQFQSQLASKFGQSQVISIFVALDHFSLKLRYNLRGGNRKNRFKLMNNEWVLPNMTMEDRILELETAIAIRDCKPHEQFEQIQRQLCGRVPSNITSKQFFELHQPLIAEDSRDDEPSTCNEDNESTRDVTDTIDECFIDSNNCGDPFTEENDIEPITDDTSNIICKPPSINDTTTMGNNTTKQIPTTTNSIEPPQQKSTHITPGHHVIEQVLAAVPKNDKLSLSPIKENEYLHNYIDFNAPFNDSTNLPPTITADLNESIYSRRNDARPKQFSNKGNIKYTIHSDVNKLMNTLIPCNKTLPKTKMEAGTRVVRSSSIDGYTGINN